MPQLSFEAQDRKCGLLKLEPFGSFDSYMKPGIPQLGISRFCGIASFEKPLDIPGKRD